MSEKDKPAGAGFFGTKKLLKKYKEDTPGESVEEVYKNSGLGKWFHSQSAGGKPGWDRYNTKGERVGECGDSKPGEGKPKCLSKQKAAKLRSQGGKNAIANAVKRKKAQDPQQDRPGTGNKPINVSNRINKEDRDMKSAKEFLNDMIMEQLNEDVLNEKNVPTDAGKWSKAKAQARAKFDVYPSAYANAWASKKYKAMGGSWTTKESAEEVGPEIAEELIDLDLSEAKKKRITKLHGKYPKGTHYCATHVEHAEFGHGNPIHSQHAAPDEFGDIDWYDVMFEHGIEQRVATDDLQIHLGEVHENHDHEEGEEIGEAMGPGIAHKDGLKDAQKTDSMQRYYAQVKKDQAARAKQIEQERKDGIRSKYESVEQVDELKKSTLMSYKDKAKKSERSGRDTGFEGETSSEREAGVRQVEKRVKGIDRATKKLVARQYEDVEQVDEISSDTLRSYVAKRRKQTVKNLSRTDGGHSDSKLKRSNRGVSHALSRLDARDPKGYFYGDKALAREDVEQVDEISSDTLRKYVYKRRGQVQSDLNTGKHSPKTNKKAKGVVAALSRLDARKNKLEPKLKREEVEQVDELRRDTLGSYADKAQGDIEGIKNVLKAKKLGPVSDKHREALERELANRTKGRKKAIGKKYTREDAEQVDELSNKTMKSYIKKAQKDNTNRVVRMADKPDHMPADKDEMRKLRKRQKGVVNAKTDIAMRRIAGKDYRKRMGEDIELDELKMPEKDKRGRAKDPVIGAALERGSRRADLKADGKLRRGDTDGAEGHMTRSRKRQAASRTPVEEAKVGDTVHLGHASKGGSGVKGKVVKIDGINVHIKNDKGAMFKGPMDRVTVGEAIKYDSAGDSTGTVTGKGKRDRGPGGKVMVQYKGSDTYKDGAKLPIKARDIGRLIKTARKKGTKPYDSRNLSNPRLTKDHVEHGVDEGAGADAILKYARENPGAFGNKKKSKSDTKATSYRYIKDKKTGVTKLYTQGRDAKLTFVRDVQDHVEHDVAEGMADSAKRAAKILAARTPKNVHNPGRPTKKSAGDIEADRREKARRDSIDRRAARDKEMLNNREGVEDMTAAQERDRQHRDNPTRKTVAGVRLPSTDKERASYVKKFQADKAGKPGNTKPRKMRDLQMRLRGPK